VTNRREIDSPGFDQRMVSADHCFMAAKDDQPQLRHALFGFRRADVEALQDRLSRTQAELGQVRAENTQLTSGLRSARQALSESTGWSERLPVALGELASLAAGELTGDDAQGRLGSMVLAVAGEHLLAQVQVSLGDPTGELERDTSWNENGRPVRTLVRLGGCVVDCAWQPGVDAGPDTARVIESLCSAVVCSLAGVAASRVERHPKTQLGDERSLARHEALRARLNQPAGYVSVAVDEQSHVSYKTLYGGMAWDAALSRAAAELDRLARAHGGQAYHVADLVFRLLVDADAVDATAIALERELADYDGLIFHIDAP
jgi:hypothetical protein